MPRTDPIRNDTLDVAFDGLDDARERECLRLRDDASDAAHAEHADAATADIRIRRDSGRGTLDRRII
jgi:hypothetical protein